MSRITPDDTATNTARGRGRSEIRTILVGRNTFACESVTIALTARAPEISITYAPRPVVASEIINRDGDIDLVVLLFAEMTDNCIRHFELLHHAHPDVPILVSVPTEDPAKIGRIYRSGGKGILPLGTDMQLMIAAMRLVAAGGTYVPPILLDEEGRPRRPEDADTAPDLASAFPALTRRQRQVLALLARGATNKCIGGALVLRESTVKAHVKQILRKLQAGNRTEAALMASKILVSKD